MIYRLDPPRITGVLWIWTPIQMSGMHVDPLYTEAKAVVDAAGHDAEIISVAARKVPELGIVIRGEKSGYTELSEKLVVEHSGRVAPGLYVTGIASYTVYELPRMGPIFGGMLLSGRRVAQIITEDLRARRLPFQLKSDVLTALRCTNCGRVLRSDSTIIVKTCCVNSSPWVFCGKECYRQFMVKWVRNQDALRSGGRLRITL